MKVLIDTNILFSSLLYPKSKPAKVLLHASKHHEIFLCDQNVYEFYNIINRKIPRLIDDAREFLQNLSFTMIEANNIELIHMRDKKDQPILNAAIATKIDLIVTGDKDFLSLDLKQPKCITADEYCKLEDI